MKEYNIIINGKKQIMQETSGLIFLSYLILIFKTGSRDNNKQSR